MADRFLQAMNVFAWILDFTMSIGLIALMFIASEILYFLILIVMAIYWPGRLKREIEENHQGSWKNYIKYLFTRRKNKCEEDDSGNKQAK